MKKAFCASLFCAALLACGSTTHSDACASYADKALKCTNAAQTAETKAALETCQSEAAGSPNCAAAVTKVASCFADSACADIVAGTSCNDEQTAMVLACPKFGATANPNG